MAKALAVAAYGESVAAYRYRTMVEKAPADELRDVFAEMAAEEQDHHMQVRELSNKHFPDSDFVLTPGDKELVIVGPRLLEFGTTDSAQSALDMVYESERLTGRFYAALHDETSLDELKPLLQEMADECFQHAGKLKALPKWD